jgi:hypothetical protein
MSTEEEDIRGFRQWNPSMQEDLLILRFVPVTFRSFLIIRVGTEVLVPTRSAADLYSTIFFDVDLGLDPSLHNNDRYD